MADSAEELADNFGDLSPEVLAEFQNMLRLYSIDAEELYIKWEAYCIKMGDDVKPDMKNVVLFKREAQEEFEAEMKSKAKVTQTPATRGPQKSQKGDVFNMLDGLVPATPRTGPAKRKADKASYETPLAERTSRLAVASSPIGPPSSFKLPGSPASATAVPFRDRRDPGKVMEVLNSEIPLPSLPLPGFEGAESRITITANVDVKKFAYRPMYMKLNEASQYLDDRIEFYAEEIQKENNIPEDDFCNPNSVLPEEVVVVGRIVSDALDVEKRTVESSLLLESSRGRSKGIRVPLDLTVVQSYSLFPGMLVAFRGTNPSGKKFIVSSIIGHPRYPQPATAAAELEAAANRLALGNLNVFMAAGPYTTDDNLEFEALIELVDKIVETEPDVVFLNGPFIDTDHPKVQLGDFPVDWDTTSGYILEDLFQQKITSQLSRITKSIIFLVPSTRDAVSKHVSYPQEGFARKLLGLNPANVKLLTNPCMISINEIVFGISSADILFHLSMEEVRQKPKDPNMFSRVANHVISQHHFYPLFPAPTKAQVGHHTPLDVPWLGLADFAVKPDVLILPSNLPGTVKAIDGVVIINPGFLSKKTASNTYAFMTVQSPQDIIKDSMDPKEQFKHRVYNRARVEIRRI